MRLRERLARQRFPEIYDSVLEILFRHDPVGICFRGNPRRETEYGPEVNTILPRLREASSESALHNIVYEEFQYWFDESAGPKERYTRIATDLWELVGT